MIVFKYAHYPALQFKCPLVNNTELITETELEYVRIMWKTSLDLIIEHFIAQYTLKFPLQRI